jgi:hypothetical protein
MASRNDAVPSPNRRFPPPWSVEETDACFIVRDHNGQALAYTYFEKRARKSLGGAPPHPRRGAPDRRQHRQAAGVARAIASYTIEVL